MLYIAVYFTTTIFDSMITNEQCVQNIFRSLHAMTISGPPPKLADALDRFRLSSTSLTGSMPLRKACSIIFFT